MINERNRILQEIDRLLETFTEQYLNAREHLQIIPLIEIDLMKNSLQNLYQQLDHLSKIQDSSFREEPVKSVVNPIPSIAQSNLSEYPESEINITSDKSIAFANLLLEDEATIVETPLIGNTIQNVETELSEEKIPEMKTGMEQPIIQLTNAFVASASITASPTEIKTEVEKRVVIEKEKDVIIEKKETTTIHQSAILFDQPSSTIGGKFKEQETLYAQISKSRNDETVADKLHKKPLVDLKKSIGINERFSFINELFSGNQHQFSESIDKINGFTNYEEAYHELHIELASKMNWNKKSPTFLELNDLIKRRFSS